VSGGNAAPSVVDASVSVPGEEALDVEHAERSTKRRAVRTARL
jgi:hypothetical protein